MTKRVQVLGHTHEIANAFIGLEREITVDTDNWELRLHDESTPGGWLILNRDQNDARYQARSVELDGLLGWEPNERGQVTRLGPANYALRTVTGTTGQITVTNGNGFAGNPTISLPSEITADLLFSGEITFGQPITGDLIGNVTGGTTGTHTGNVVGNVTGNLTGNANGNHTGSFTGDVDVRGHTLQMDPGQIELGWLSDEILSTIEVAGVPIGTIVAFGLSIGEIPANWFVCDGTNGTPDLRDKFIVAAGTTYTAGSSGGTATHTHGVTIESGGAHNHSATAAGTAISITQMPAHYHGNGVTNTDADLYCYGSMAAAPTTTESIDDNSSNGTLQGLTETIGGGATHTHTITVDSGGAHTHTGTTAAGSSLPPYYALIYIMKGS